MKFQIYTTADWRATDMSMLLAKYPALATYRMHKTKDGVTITITSMKELAQLVDDLKRDVILGKGGWNVKDSIEIYDEYRE